MIKDGSILLEDENSRLANYAVKHDLEQSRQYKESKHSYRLAFQRDKDRIVHSKSFKRLQYKTQVFVFSVGENYRNRLTHTLEVAGIAKTISQNLALNHLLCESIALAHDLGHTPFGHAGQDKLNEMMKHKGGFEHNQQSVRIVQLLEKIYPNFSGLNLCKETIKGLMKYNVKSETKELNLERKKNGPSLEACIVDFSDGIAYNTHDIEDGLENGILQLEDLNRIEFWYQQYQNSKRDYPTVNSKILQRMTIRSMINHMTENLIKNTNKNLIRYKIQNRQDLVKKYQEKIEIVSYSNEMKENLKILKSFLYKRLYNHKKVTEVQNKSLDIMEALFEHFLKNSHKTPEKYQERIKEDGLYRGICDYIAGMTDRYAEILYKEIYS